MNPVDREVKAIVGNAVAAAYGLRRHDDYAPDVEPDDDDEEEEAA